MPHFLMPQHSFFSRDYRIFFFFNSNLKNNNTIEPVTISASLQLIQIPNQTPFNNTIIPQTILRVSFSNIVFSLASSILLTKIKFLVNPEMWRKQRSVLVLPCMIFNSTFPRHMILVVESSPRKTSPPSYLSYSQNHYVLGVI
jgi:hypothetical protein